LRIEGSGALGVLLVGILILFLISAFAFTLNNDGIYLVNTHLITYGILLFGFLFIIALLLGLGGRASVSF